ncbi:MAG: KOW domain-containing RNA-binding protein [Lachnospiraceae bacterium]|nr:KOW domain-containing RNA-binding protein [Lachnospiraceae bacterium]
MITGYYVRSLSGRDAGKVYIVIKQEGDMLYLSDGMRRSMENPKKKKEKHVQIIKKNGRLEKISNEEIKQAVRQYEKKQGNEMSGREDA